MFIIMQSSKCNFVFILFPPICSTATDFDCIQVCYVVCFYSCSKLYIVLIDVYSSTDVKATMLPS